MGRPDEIAAIEGLLREVGAFQLEGYRSLGPGGIEVKEDAGHGMSVVTRFDVETERRVQAFLEGLFPGDSFLGEELGAVRRDPSRHWILDPIDGTSNFTQGIPFWGPYLALWDDRGPARAWIHLPALGQMFRAERGGGAFLDGRPIHTSRVTEYSNLATVATVSRMHRRFRLTCPAKHRILGSIVANLAYLASGTFAAIYCRGSLWDIAAGILIAREAGAVIETDPPLESLRPAELEPGRSPSVAVWGTANPELPPFRRYLEPLERPVEGR
jgi:myo-inositol-1(or 4)-monophosphatase